MVFKVEPLVALALVGAVVALCIAAKPVEAGPNLIRDFKELLALTNKLESAQMQIQANDKPERINKRRELLYVLARNVKSDQCLAQFDTANKVASEFKVKGYQFVEDSKKKKNWFSFISKINGPMGSLKNLGKFDQFLNSVAERYEAQENSGTLSVKDVDCDVHRFLVRSIHDIMFVLQTDIKYLILEEQQTLNKAIYEQLRASGYVANNNFYEIPQLSQTQKKILLDYFAQRNDANKVTIAQSVDHFYNPGEFIIGRLLDSCAASIKYELELRQLRDNYDQACKGSTSDPKGSLFPMQFKFDRYDEIFSLCHNLMNAL